MPTGCMPSSTGCLYSGYSVWQSVCFFPASCGFTGVLSFTSLEKELESVSSPSFFCIAGRELLFESMVSTQVHQKIQGETWGCPLFTFLSKHYSQNISKRIQMDRNDGYSTTNNQQPPGSRRCCYAFCRVIVGLLDEV